MKEGQSMIYLKRIKGKNLVVNSFGMNDFLMELYDKSMTYAHALHDEIARIINGIVENHQGEGQPRKYSPRDDGMSLGDFAGSLAGLGFAEGMRGQTLIGMTIPNKIIDKIEETPWVGPYIPGTIPTRITILLGNGVVFIPEVCIGILGAGVPQLIPGINTPIPGTEYIKPTFDEIKDGVDDAIEWGVDQVPKIFDIPGNIWNGTKTGIEKGVKTSSEAVNTMLDSAKHIMSVGVSCVEIGVGAAADVAGTASGAIQDGVYSGVDFIGSTAGDIINGEVSGAKNSYNFLLNEGKAVWSGAYETSKTLVKAGYGVVSSGVQGAYGIGHGVYGFVGTIIGE